MSELRYQEKMARNEMRFRKDASRYEKSRQRGLDETRRAAWNRQKILVALAAWKGEHGEWPRRAEWTKSDGGKHPSNDTVVRHFGSWSHAIEEAERELAE